FDTLDPALAYIRGHAEPLVVKASGLAGGKGAVVCATRDAAARTARAMLADGAWGDAGREIVVEQFLEGEELSVLALTDGERILVLPAAQDHKRLREGDAGPNTGGMGAYCPVGIATDGLLDRVPGQAGARRRDHRATRLGARDAGVSRRHLPRPRRYAPGAGRPRAQRHRAGRHGGRGRRAERRRLRTDRVPGQDLPARHRLAG